MVNIKTFIYPLLFLSLFACNNHQAETDIKNTIHSVYLKPNVYYQLRADTVLLSKQLRHLVARAKEVEELDLQRVRNSEYPTDKPLLIEGEIFTSIYEGYTKFDVNEIVINYNNAKAVVQFKNDSYNLSWADTMMLINESGWKLEDVRYGKDGGSLHKTLKEFIGSYK
jgi:hypothetical protein